MAGVGGGGGGGGQVSFSAVIQNWTILAGAKVAGELASEYRAYRLPISP